MTVGVSAVIAIVPLVAATWLIPPAFPLLLRQLLLFTWGVGAILAAERMCFSGTLGASARAVGFVTARPAALLVAVLVSVPMWCFLPLYASSRGVEVTLRAEWIPLLLGVVLVNGITEEVIHRGFAFGHWRRGRTFVAAATYSALLFAAQHLYIVLTAGWTIGLASVLLAALLAYPLAFVFERGGNSLGGPAILHTSTNAPVIIWSLPDDFLATALLPHMGVLLVSLYLVFAARLLTNRPGGSQPPAFSLHR